MILHSVVVTVCGVKSSQVSRPQKWAKWFGFATDFHSTSLLTLMGEGGGGGTAKNGAVCLMRTINSGDLYLQSRYVHALY